MALYNETKVGKCESPILLPETSTLFLQLVRNVAGDVATWPPPSGCTSL